jgi:hypothetical protein
MPQYKTLAEAATARATNTRLPCSVKGCNKPRMVGTLSQYCQAHRKTNRAHGDPLGRAVPSTVFKRREVWVRKLLTLPENADRAFLQDALGAIKSATDAAIFATRPTPTQRTLLERCVSRQVSPMDILVRLVSLGLWLHENPKKGPPTDKAVEFAYANAWVRRHGDRTFDDIGLSRKTVPATALQELGTYAKQHTALLLSHVIVAREAMLARGPERDPMRPLTVAPKGKRPSKK